MSLRKRWRLVVVLALALALAVVGLGIWSEPERADYRWFDTLGFPDLGKCPLVRVTLQHPADPAGVGGGHEHYHGFLLDRDERTIRLLDYDLRQIRILTQPVPGEPAYRVEVTELDVRRPAEAALGPQPADGPDPAVGPEFDTPLRLFVLARACAKRGHSELASRLYHRSMELADAVPPRVRPMSAAWFARVWSTAMGRRSATPKFRDEIRLDIADSLWMHASNSFDDAANARASVLGVIGFREHLSRAEIL